MGLTLLLASPALAAPADLDGSFSGDGKQLVDFGAFDRATHVALTPDGRIVVVGSTNVNDPGDYAVTRLAADGTPDGSFGSGGKVTLGTQSLVTDVGGGVVVLPDERIVVSGQGNGGQDFVTKRLNANGSLDTTFAGAGAGTSTIDFGGDDSDNVMARQPDGKLVLVGSTSTGGGDFAIARLERGRHARHDVLRRRQADRELRRHRQRVRRRDSARREDRRRRDGRRGQ